MKNGRYSRIQITLVLFLSLSIASSAIPPTDEERNIVISSASENYRFNYSKTNNSVEVKQETINHYTCLNYRDKGSFFEFFDNQSTLDGIELYENGSKSYADKALTNYSIEDIFYSDARVYNLILNFPKSGWQNEIRLKKTIKDPRYFCTIYFNESYPVLQKEITVTVPRWMKADIREFNFEGYNVTRQQSYSEKEDADVFKYTIKDLAERKPENHQPGPSYFLPHLLVLSKSASINGQQFTFFNTLKDQYTWYKKITALLKNDESIIKAKATEITQGSKTDIEKIKSVLYWVHDNIRYIAFEDGIAGFKPDEAQNVLSKKYGDCKGMANLTKELLKSLGFDARLAWIGTNYIAYDYSTPSLCVDNHMICCLIYKGKKYFLDGTESYLPFEDYAERIQGRQVLIEDGDNYLLEKVPATSFEQNLCQFTENLHISNNSLTGNVVYLYRGESKEQLLSAIHSTKKEKLDALLEKYITNNNKSYTINDIKTSDLNQMDGDLSIKFKMDYAGAVSSFGKELYIDIDYNKFFNQDIIDTLNRKYDYRFYYKYNYSTEISLEIPDDYKLSSLPTDFEVHYPGFDISVKFNTENNSIRYKKYIHITNTLLKKNSFTEWNKAITQLSSRYLDQIILVKK